MLYKYWYVSYVDGRPPQAFSFEETRTDEIDMGAIPRSDKVISGQIKHAAHNLGRLYLRHKRVRYPKK